MSIVTWAIKLVNDDNRAIRRGDLSATCDPLTESIKHTPVPELDHVPQTKHTFVANFLINWRIKTTY